MAFQAPSDPTLALLRVYGWIFTKRAAAPTRAQLVETIRSLVGRICLRPAIAILRNCPLPVQPPPESAGDGARANLRNIRSERSGPGRCDRPNAVMKDGLFLEACERTRIAGVFHAWRAPGKGTEIKGVKAGGVSAVGAGAAGAGGGGGGGGCLTLTEVEELADPPGPEAVAV